MTCHQKTNRKTIMQSFKAGGLFITSILPQIGQQPPGGMMPSQLLGDGAGHWTFLQVETLVDSAAEIFEKRKTWRWCGMVWYICIASLRCWKYFVNANFETDNFRVKNMRLRW